MLLNCRLHSQDSLSSRRGEESHNEPTLLVRRGAQSLSYFRHNHRWTYSRIQKAYFPSLSTCALKRAHQRLSAEDRVRRASAAAALITSSHNTGLSSVQRSVPRPIPQSESHTETSIQSSPNSENGDGPVTPNNSYTNRYNLRSNRPKVFRKESPDIWWTASASLISSSHIKLT